MDSVVHFEMPAIDRKRVAEFYGKVFGWKTEQLGPKMGNYVLATTTETDDKGMIKNTGAINGGFYQKTESAPHPAVVISVANLEESIEKVRDSGGKVIGGAKAGEPDDIPGIGRFISILDSEGNRVGMLQPVSKK
jgi:predicted enzyme related to lactoylglutathione lyase